ncbi:uncharacterized protein [Parasteatoda tepidariorum]|uniref:uncharacterized protein n=1 Tax=Parasteatoda tepidariorum TaxID=114398 RepID=UPI001C721160|nr:uncharacterized protein LOC107439052 [Parasteatoda tepidariorum]
MKGCNVGPTLYWVLVVTVALLYTHSTMAGAITAFKLRRNFTAVDRLLKPESSIRIPRRLPRPPKLLIFRTSTEEETTTEDYTSADESTTTSDTSNDVESASDNSLSVVWPLRARPAKRFRIPTPTTPTPQLLLKLRQPKPTRPAIYSLDGFVPKPSIQRIVSTEPPLNFKKTDLQLLSSIPRRRKMNRYSKEDDDNEYEYVGRRKKQVSRYTAFARRGVPGEDYPVYNYIPQTDFTCGPQPGLYADPFTDCQAWHMCPGGNLSPRHSFLCPNGTIFNQKKRICDWWYNVDCRKRKVRSQNSLGESSS